jgi:ABC-2 type transport system ATP-binding protein
MIHVNNLQKKFKQKEVLQAVSFSIDEPKIIALVGHNGAGKSTLLKLLAGRLQKDDGEVFVNELNPFQQLSVAKQTVLIEDKMPFDGGLTILEHFKWAGKFYPNWQQELAEKLCEYAGIAIKNKYMVLSKGQAATFRLIYGLCTRSPYTYLDEPMNGMDDAIRSDFYRVILKEYIEAPRTIIFSTHYLHEIKQLVEDVMILHDGNIKLYASIDELEQYAVVVKGETTLAKTQLHQAEILYENEHEGYYEAVVKTTSIHVADLKANGLHVSNAEAHVVARHLTTFRKGGLDHVYK